MSRKREPTKDELALWSAVTKSIAPLDKRPPPKEPPPKATVATAPEKSTGRPTAGHVAPARPPPPPAKVPSLHPIDRRTHSRLARGTLTIDARIDLHGLTQAAAHQRLRRFLADQQENGARVVLVITGKGQSGDGERADRGVLKRMVPAWLTAPELRPIVIGFDEAGRGHGGSGALYVRIRRKG